MSIIRRHWVAQSSISKALQHSLSTTVLSQDSHRDGVVHPHRNDFSTLRQSITTNSLQCLLHGNGNCIISFPICTIISSSNEKAGHAIRQLHSLTPDRSFASKPSSGKNRGAVVRNEPSRMPLEVDDSDTLPPGSALKKSLHHQLEDSDESKKTSPPPWLEVSQEHLHHKLQEYKTDLVLGRKPTANVALSKTGEVSYKEASVLTKMSTSSLPFLEEAVSGVVEAEQRVLASSLSSLSSAKREALKSLGVFLGRTDMREAAQRYTSLWKDDDYGNGEEFKRNASTFQYKKSNSIAPGIIMNDNRITRGSKQGEITDEDQLQALLAARANHVISVLATIESRLPLAPRQRQSISRAVAHSLHSIDGNASIGVDLNRMNDYVITPSSAHAALAFLLRDAGLTLKQTAETIASHPWILGMQSIKSKCSNVLESLYLLNMTNDDVASIITAYPPLLKLSAEKDILPVLEYLIELGFSEQESTKLLKKAPKLMLEKKSDSTKAKISGTVAFWVGRGMSRECIRNLLFEAPEITTMSLRLLQIKADWLKEHAGLRIEDFATVPSVVVLPLTTTVGPRLAFAKHRNIHIIPPSSSTSGQLPLTTQNQQGQREGIALETLVESSYTDFLALVNNATDLEYRGFEAAWRETDMAHWLQSRLFSASASEYESMEWLAEEELTPLREMHDRHVALRELAWESQEVRDQDWESIWKDWKRVQLQKEQFNVWGQRARKRREAELLHRAASLLADTPDGKQPWMCSKGVFCDRYENHTGACNSNLLIEDSEFSKLTPKPSMVTMPHHDSMDEDYFDDDEDDDVEIMLGDEDGSDVDDGDEVVVYASQLAKRKKITHVSSNHHPTIPIHELAAQNESLPHIRDILAKHIDSMEDVDAHSDGHGEEEGREHEHQNEQEAIDHTILNAPNHDASTMAWECTQEDIENQSIDQVLRCAAGLESLLQRVPGGVLPARVLNQWAHLQGYTRGVVSAAKGVLSSAGIARAVMEPSLARPHHTTHHDHHHSNVSDLPCKVWQLLDMPKIQEADHDSVSSLSSSASLPEQNATPKLTKSSQNVAAIGEVIYGLLGCVSNRSMESEDLQKWIRANWVAPGGTLPIRNAISVLEEQGLVVQRRKTAVRGGSSAGSGVVELVRVDLSKYLAIAPSLESYFHVGEELKSPQHLAVDWRDRIQICNGSSDPLRLKAARTNNAFTKFETLPPQTVFACANSILGFLTQVADGMSHRTVNAWIRQQGFTSTERTAAKALLFSSGAAHVATEPENADFGVTQKLWSDTRAGVMLNTRSRTGKLALAMTHPLLSFVRSSPGGMVSRMKARQWAQNTVSPLHDYPDYRHVFEVAVTTLQEAGCLVVTSVPIDSKKVKMLVAVDLRQYSGFVVPKTAR